MQSRAIPLPLATRTVEGVVVWPDGTPAAGAEVEAWSAEYPNGQLISSATANGEGRFVLKVFVEGKQMIEGGAPEDPNAKLGEFQYVRSEPVRLPPGGDVSGVRLVLDKPVNYDE